jgi:hypothetical protein
MCFRKLKSIFKKKQEQSQVSSPDIGDYDVDKNEDHFTPIINTKDMNTENTNSNHLNNDGNTPPEFEYLEKLIRYRLNKYFPSDEDSTEPPFPKLSSWHLPWSDFVKKNNLEYKQDEITLLLIGITPHIRPDLFDRAIERKINGSGDFPGIGGVRGKNCRFFLPTGETALFLIAGEDFTRRLQVQQLFGAEHLFWEKKIIWLEDMQNGEPSMHGRLIISPDYVNLLTYGVHTSPQFSISFPAKKIAPGKKNNAEKKYNPPSFDQLVIPDELHEQIGELKSWLKYNDQLMDKFGMRNKLRQGYRTLFYGPPGTGKTFTAQILGNDLQKEVYKIDLSMVVSKYIGETEKNLELLFARAEDKGWILFFDEADALFGKRTNVRDAHDKYANQEVSYLLQRIEDYNGLVILATNMMNNIDTAFIRRFNSILKFPFPDAALRARIWRIFLPKDKLYRDKPGVDSFPDKYDADCRTLPETKEVDIPEAVKKYELSGGSIMNVVHYAGIKGVEKLTAARTVLKEKAGRHVTTLAGSPDEQQHFLPEPSLVIYLTDILDGIRREMIKEGKPFSL